MGRTARGRGGGESKVPSAGHTRLGQARPPAGSMHHVHLQPAGQARDRSEFPCSDMTRPSLKDPQQTLSGQNHEDKILRGQESPLFVPTLSCIF